MHRLPGLSLLLLLGLACCRPALAANCSVSATGVAFGLYDTSSATPRDGVGDIAVKCDLLTAYSVSLSTGSGSYADRRMTTPGGTLGYNLYTDLLRLLVWGDGSFGTLAAAGVGTVGTAHLPVYGRIPAQQNVGVGSYSDNVTVTVTY